MYWKMLLRRIFASIIWMRQLLIKLLMPFSRQEMLRIAIVGGSNSVMRMGYVNHLNRLIGKATDRLTQLNYYSLGGTHSVYGLIQADRQAIAINNDVIFFEYSVNDRYAIEQGSYSLDLAGKVLEGFIRKVRDSNPNCLIVILLFRHLDHFYDDHCQLDDLFGAIAQKYNLPVVDVTASLRQSPDLSQVKALYEESDPSHYSRPQGVETVAQIIADQLNEMGVMQDLRLGKPWVSPQNLPPIYPDNFQGLAFFDRFDQGKFFAEKLDASIYQNSIFREKYFPISQDNALRFLLKGRLLAVFVKADLDHGFIQIEFDNDCIITSTYASWLNPVKPRNAITLVTLPSVCFSESLDFVPVSISNCSEQPQSFELEYHKILPRQQDPRKWKLNIIGIAYIGELKPEEPIAPNVMGNRLPTRMKLSQ
jgi:hypothetical protein